MSRKKNETPVQLRARIPPAILAQIKERLKGRLGEQQVVVVAYAIAFEWLTEAQREQAFEEATRVLKDEVSWAQIVEEAASEKVIRAVAVPSTLQASQGAGVPGRPPKKAKPRLG